MKITRPEPQPRDDGDYLTYVNGVAYGKPYARIYLDEAKQLVVADITLEDARRLARAAAQVEQELAAAHARMTAPHGSDHFYQGTCQLCGKPEDDELHAELKPLVISDSTIEQARYLAEHPDPEPPATLAESIRTGTPLPVADDDMEDDPASPVGTIVALATDDSPSPLTGRITGQVDEDTYEVAWGDQQYAAEPRTTRAFHDELRPVTA